MVTYYYDESLPVYLLMVFAKNEQADLSMENKRELRETIAAIKTKHKLRKLS